MLINSTQLFATDTSLMRVIKKAVLRRPFRLVVFLLLKLPALQFQ